MLSVVYISWVADGFIAIEPFAVQRGTGSSFTGLPCRRCALLDDVMWRREGVDAFLDLLRRAPWQQENEIEGWPSTSTEGLPRLTRVCGKATKTGGTFGQVTIVPSWRPYQTKEAFRFTKPPAPATFAAEVERLLGMAYG